MRLCFLFAILTLTLYPGPVLAQYRPSNATPPVPTAAVPPPINSTTSASNSSAIVPTFSASIATPVTSATTSVPTTTVSPEVKAASLPGSMDKIDDKRLLLIGDMINYRVTEDGDPAKTLSILDTGEIDVPYLGRIPAAGKTLHKLAEEIKVLLEKDYYYQATVLLAMDATNRIRGRIYVVGQVHGPGVQEIPVDETYTVSKAILKAGGFGDFADQRKVQLVRKKDPNSKETDTTVVDCKEIFKKGNTANDPVVQPEDWIIVPQRLVNF